jgi:hypothetical protein
MPWLEGRQRRPRVFGRRLAVSFSLAFAVALVLIVLAASSAVGGVSTAN